VARFIRITGLALSASVLALALGACASSDRAFAPSTMDAPAAAVHLAPAATPKLGVSPAKLNFTTKPTIKMTISESKYTGKFKIAVSPAGIVKISTKSAKGPHAKVTVTAVAAGKATISVSDDQGGKKSVPVTVTQGVIIIQ
jgi:hypothetical protein